MQKEITGTVSCPTSYFRKMATVDYTNWKQALAREFFQNSIDAGATEIRVGIAERNGVHLITIIDNGCGMNKDIILEKLLVLGGSHKAKGSVGAFGKAKELLYFSWNDWSIRTKDIFVEGQGPNYKITNTDEYVKGTISSITLDCSDVVDFSAYFTVVAERMYRPTKIYINGSLVRPRFNKGSLVDEFPFGKLYINKSNKGDGNISFNVAGIWMFETYANTGNVGKFTFELSKSSIEMLTSNRDDMRWEYKLQVSKVVNKIVTEKESMSREKNQKTLKEYFYKDRPGRTNFVLEPVPVALTTVEKAPYYMTTSKNGLPVLKGYSSDYVVSYDKKMKAMAKRFLKQKRATTLMKIWASFIHQISKDIGFDESVNIIPGFSFDLYNEAEIAHVDGKYEIYINPLKIGKTGGWTKHMTSNRFFLTEDLKDKAVHEFSHIRTTYHDETFVLEMHRIRSLILKSHKIYAKIGRIK